MSVTDRIMMRVVFFLLAGLLLSFPGFSTALETNQSTCIKCHLESGDELANPVLELNESIHKEKEVFCHDCHGGDPTAEDQDEAMSEEKGFVGIPDPVEIPEFCAKCHADPSRMKQYNLRTDQFAEYKTSVHGKRLYEKGDENVATCVNCHGDHAIKSKNDPRASVFKTNIPKTCSRCHSDPKRMGPYGIPTNQYALYVKSVHGKRLLEKKDLRAPGCADCHGIHGASPPGFTEIANVCSYCHGKIAKYFKQSPHYIGKTKEKGTRCINCHSHHNIQRPTTEMYAGATQGHCGQCHEQGSRATKVAEVIKEKIELAISAVDEAAKGLESVRHSGKNLDKIRERFENATSFLVQSRALAHTLSLQKIKSKVHSVLTARDKVTAEVGKIRMELQSRKRSIIIVLLILATIIAFLLIKSRSLSSSR